MVQKFRNLEQLGEKLLVSFRYSSKQFVLAKNIPTLPEIWDEKRPISCR